MYHRVCSIILSNVSLNMSYFLYIFMISKGFYLYKLVMIDLSKQDRKYV